MTKSLSIAAMLASLAAAAPARGAPGGGRVETGTFSMHCYWTGEAALGREAGVLATRIGHLEGREIVRVEFDPDTTSAPHLLAAIHAIDPSAAMLDSGEAGQRPRFVESKHTLRTQHPDLYFLDLSERQAMELNAWAYFGGRMPDLLSADQEQRRRRLDRRLKAGAAVPLDPSGARTGAALDAYRRLLTEWLSRD